MIAFAMLICLFVWANSFSEANGFDCSNCSGCVWRGTAPFCDGHCNDGETQIMRIKSCDGSIKGCTCVDFGHQCVFGHKSLCCPQTSTCN
uniref:Uncharacterized protein n=1 Tax=Acrobeloides nanus TaxID=290746 RepID=A0A914DMD2_9BILA